MALISIKLAKTLNKGNNLWPISNRLWLVDFEEPKSTSTEHIAHLFSQI